tara:strand:+ start:591 stop:1097 length:507 start_codon:yes stop_codon:yes gene_type:complete
VSSVVFLNETTGSSVDGVTVDNVFSADYDCYKVVVHYDGSTNDTANCRFIKASDGSLVADTDYNHATKFMYNHTTHVDSQLTNQPEISAAFAGVATEGGGVAYIHNPFDADFTYLHSQSVGDAGSSAPSLAHWTTGVLKQNVSMRGFKVLSGSGTFGNIKIRTYGISK